MYSTVINGSPSWSHPSYPSLWMGKYVEEEEDYIPRRMNSKSHHKTRPRKHAEPPVLENDPAPVDSGRFPKYGFLVFNSIALLASCAVLAAGIYMFASETQNTVISNLLENRLYEVISYISLVTGAVAILVSSFGFFGLLYKNPHMFVVYIFFMALVFMTILIGGVLGFALRQEILPNLRSTFAYSISYKYGKEDNVQFTKEIDKMQAEHKCCGAFGDENSTTSWAVYKGSQWYKQFTSGSPYVPDSCCTANGNVQKCTGMVPINGPPTARPPLTDGMESNTDLYTQGCYTYMQDELEEKILIMACIAFGSLVIILFAVLFGSCMIRELRRRQGDEKSLIPYESR